MSRPTSRRNARRRGPVRCHSCHQRITVFGSPFRPGRWMTFEVTPVDPRHLTTAEGDVFPVWLRRAYRPEDLIAELQGLTRGTVEEAREEALDMPWHRLHRCQLVAKIAGGDA